MPPRPAQRTNGSLSARQWQDLRQAARLARSEDVTITWRGVNNITIHPGSPRLSGPDRGGQEVRSTRPRDKGATHPPEPEGTPALSKKQQRSARRLQEHRGKMRAEPEPGQPGLVAERWHTLTQAALRRSRWQQSQAVWTQWMRARLSPRRDACRKLRLAFWREWTRPQFAPGPGISETADPERQLGFADLGPRSHRDEYILKLARARCARLADACPWALRPRRIRYWLGGEWDPDGGGCLNAGDRRGHTIILDQLRMFGKLEVPALRRTAKSAREALLQQFEDCMEFSPRNTDLPVVTAAIRASLRDDAAEPGGTTTRGRKDGARERDEPSSSRADRKRSGRR